jgi:hypothetical protein
MSPDKRSDGLLLRGTPPYPWWQWLLVALIWGAVMFVVLGALTSFKDAPLTAVVVAVAAAGFTLWTRLRIVARERRRGGA